MAEEANRPLREIVRSSGMLMLIAAAVTAALALTNTLTKDTIQQHNEAEADKSRRMVIAADTFEARTVSREGNDLTYYEAVQGGETVGYVFTFSAAGKSAGLVVMTGIDTEGVVTGVTVTQNNETAGYVKKVEKAGLFERFRGLKTDRALTLGADVDGVSQATKTSRGVTDGVNQAAALYRYLKSNGGVSDEG